tara:strand:+ start:348 stop:1358 length:1011 start_codon:yes stop_codon:yes gene_type:complete
MLKIEDLEKIDTKAMFRTYDKWPDIAIESFETEYEKFDAREIDHIVFAGMGGSGSIGDTISAILSKNDIHVSNVKGYLLPKTVDSKTLVIITSISGNTNEPLTILERAKDTDAKIASFSSGGKMELFCKSNNIFHKKIPMVHSPRASFPSFLFSILNILEPILPIKKGDIKESLSKLQKTKMNIFSENLISDNKSLELANFIKNIVCVYYPVGLQAAAVRYKNSLQENAKIHAMTEDIIESCHNGIVPWEVNSDISPVFIQGQDDYVKTKERWRIFEEFFEKNDLQYYRVSSLEGSIISKITNLVYLLDYSSIYSSVLNNIDPSPVNAIDFIKQRL